MAHETQVGVAGDLNLCNQQPASEAVLTAGPTRYNPDSVIRHSTVHQILKADRVHSTAPFRIEGNEFKTIILLGNIHLHENSADHTDFDLDDGTGRIRVRLWDRDNVMDLNEILLQPEASPYARVIGEVNSWANSNCVTAKKIELASSLYEPYYHILQAIHDTLAYERGPPAYQRVIPSLEYKESAPSDMISGSFDSVPPSPTQTSNLGASKREVTDYACTLSSIWKGKGKARSDNSPLHPSHPELDNFRDSNHAGEGSSGNTEIPSFPPTSLPPPPLVPTCLQNLDVHKLYSRLPSLDRDILNSISSTKQTNAGGQEPWKGVYLPTIVAAVKSSHDTLTVEEFTQSLERLIGGGFIFSSIDDHHYDITLSPPSD